MQFALISYSSHASTIACTKLAASEKFGSLISNVLKLCKHCLSHGETTRDLRKTLPSRITEVTIKKKLVVAHAFGSSIFQWLSAQANKNFIQLLTVDAMYHRILYTGIHMCNLHPQIESCKACKRVRKQQNNQSSCMMDGQECDKV